MSKDLSFHSLPKLRQRIAMRFGYVGLFSHRDTMKEAFDYLERVAHGTESPPHVITAGYLILNTMSLLLANVVGERRDSMVEWLKEYGKDLTPEAHKKLSALILAPLVETLNPDVVQAEEEGGE